MKLHLLHKNHTANLNYSSFEGKEFLKLWHYHPELELVYIVSGQGTLFIGDFISHFEKDNLFLIGSNIPHMFESNSNNEEVSISKVVHLNSSFLEKIAKIGDEFNYIQKILTQSSKGLKFQKNDSKKLKKLFLKLFKASHNRQVLLTFQILYHFSKTENIVEFGNVNWLEDDKIKDNRLNVVIEYIMMNFKNEILLTEVADLVNMNKTSFCRYFKQHTNITFTNYLNSIRINYACKLLKENNGSNSVSVACYNSGFNSLSYFNRVFKKTIGCAPSAYK